jgi:hypothetical protein
MKSRMFPLCSNICRIYPPQSDWLAALSGLWHDTSGCELLDRKGIFGLNGYGYDLCHRRTEYRLIGRLVIAFTGVFWALMIEQLGILPCAHLVHWRGFDAGMGIIQTWITFDGTLNGG